MVCGNRFSFSCAVHTITIKTFSMHLNANDLSIVEQVKAILKKEYKNRHTQAKLAEQLHISERKLRKIFKQATDKTIYEFHTEVRIERAKDLLATTDYPVKTIAYTVGLTISSLEKQLKSITGTTPLEWRITNRESKEAC
jgi:transcriptional regulator GlxA family with amidase domain